MPADWMLRWTAAGVIGATVVGGYTLYVTQRKSVEASVGVISVQRAGDKDGEGYVAFNVNCLVNNSGNVPVSVSFSEPYALGMRGAPDKPLTKAGANPLSKSVVQTEGGKQEPFQVTVYFDKDFVEEGRRQQLPVPTMAPPWIVPGAGVRVGIKVEARAGDGTYWSALMPPQTFVFTSGTPKVAGPVDLTPAAFAAMTTAPAHLNIFR